MGIECGLQYSCDRESCNNTTFVVGIFEKMPEGWSRYDKNSIYCPRCALDFERFNNSCPSDISGKCSEKESE